MSLPDLTRLATQVGAIYSQQLGIEQDGMWLLAKMQEELGELSGAHLSAAGLSRSRGKTQPELDRDVEDEAADLLGFLLIYAAREGIDLEAALTRKWGRYLPQTGPCTDAEGDAEPGHDA